ncbi:hypothetical protein, partial [Deinococcus wulumuqiensis]|uniref:hypothetical protein n=1 Tax=Deinococcus wulumuqiensis TaxID=980427 RepID=UPI0024306820
LASAWIESETTRFNRNPYDVAAALLQLLRLPGVEAVEGEVVRSALSLYAGKTSTLPTLIWQPWHRKRA